MADEYLSRKYGDRVRVRYHDLTDPFVHQQSQEFLARRAQQRWPLPVVLVDGEMVLRGHLDFPGLVTAVVRTLQQA